MKKVFFLAILLVGIGLQAQPGPKHGHRSDRMETLKDMSPEQRAALRSKQLVLQLDLSDKQQSQIAALLLQRELDRPEIRPDRKELKELSTNQRFQLMNQKLDREISFNRQLKSILTADQWTKYTEAEALKKQRRRSSFGAMKR